MDDNTTTYSLGQSTSDEQAEQALDNYNFAKFTDRVKFLHRQLTSPLRNPDDQYRIYVKAGCQMFDAEGGFVVSSLGSVYRKIVVHREGNYAQTTSLSDTEEAVYSSIVERGHTGTGTAAAKKLTNPGNMFHGGPPTVHYFGAPLVVAGNKCGAISFLSRRRFTLSSDDIETLKLMAEGVARMIELQNEKERNRIEDIRGFATAGVKSLDEYIHQARMPEVYGVSGRVVEVLQRRIAEKPLAIDHVSEELNLSKRTLQRRLQQQNVSFAQLRDQVRYHYAIDYLLHQAMSIDAISAALDFSDRTSFTNAFKRWTTMSPSTFRKLFRDYV